MPRICDIAHIIEAQDVGGERAQAGEDAGIAADAAGVLGEAAVADVVGAILDAPVVADGFGAGSGWQNDVADKQGGLTGSAPEPGCGGAGENVPTDADDRADMSSPLGVGQAVARREHLDQTGLVARTAVLVGRARAIEWGSGVAQRGDGVMKSGLVSFDLGDQMNAACSGLFEGFF